MHLFIRREGSPDHYILLDAAPTDLVAALVVAARSKLGVAEPQPLHLLLVPHDSADKPSAEAESRAALLDEPAHTLAAAGVRAGAWLLVRLISAAEGFPSAAGAPTESVSPTLSSLATAHSDAVEADAAVAFLQLVHAAFPAAHLMDLRATLVGVHLQPLSNRIFYAREFPDVFDRSRAAFIKATLEPSPPPPPAPAHADTIDFSPSAKYAGRNYTELEADCIVKLPLPPTGQAEWACDASTVASPAIRADDGRSLRFIAPQGPRQMLPERGEPAVVLGGPQVLVASEARDACAHSLSSAGSPLRAAETHAGSTRFSDDFYPAGSAVYIVAEVYTALGQRSQQQQAQKLLQAERLLQFLVAKQGVDSARDAALGFVFMGPRLNAAAAARLHATLVHYSVVLPRLWELLGQPAESLRPAADASLPSSSSCRILAYQLKASRPAVTAIQLEALGRSQEETRAALGRSQKDTRAALERLELLQGRLELAQMDTRAALGRLQEDTRAALGRLQEDMRTLTLAARNPPRGACVLQ